MEQRPGHRALPTIALFVNTFIHLNKTTQSETEKVSKKLTPVSVTRPKLRLTRHAEEGLDGADGSFRYFLLERMPTLC